MRFAWIFLALMVNACGTHDKTPVNVDPLLNTYFQSFEKDTGVSTAGISAQFADTSGIPNAMGETVGVCYVWTDGTKLIQIDPNYFAFASESTRQELVYHELGHCALGLAHIPTLLANGCPKSIMYPATFGYSWCYLSNESYYFQELTSHR